MQGSGENWGVRYLAVLERRFKQKGLETGSTPWERAPGKAAETTWAQSAAGWWTPPVQSWHPVRWKYKRRPMFQYTDEQDEIQSSELLINPLTVPSRHLREQLVNVHMCIRWKFMVEHQSFGKGFMLPSTGLEYSIHQHTEVSTLTYSYFCLNCKKVRSHF